MPDLTFIVPCFNASLNATSLVSSLKAQEDPSWRAIVIDDASEDGTGRAFEDATVGDDRFTVIVNPQRTFALRNIVATAKKRVKAGAVAVIDGDDELCNPQTVRLVKQAHSQAGTVAWTAHRWDTNGINVSREMPQGVDPYAWPWSSSHLKTFDVGLLASVPESNFKDHLGRWFERGYDQALMIPLLKVASRRTYIDEVCYLYKIDSVSMPSRDWAERDQLRTINMVRARGFLDV